MPRLIVTIDGVTVRDVQLTRERTTIGRRPYNDVVIDNLAVSGDHAAIVRSPDGVYLEDLGSTNGTFLNGRSVQRSPLQHQDTIDIGKYRLRYIDEVPTAEFEKTMLVRPAPASPAPLSGEPAGQGPGPGAAPLHKQAQPPVELRLVEPEFAPASEPEPIASPGRQAASPPETPRRDPAAEAPAARVKVVSGQAAGRELPLHKVVTTIGRPGGAVAAITRRGAGYTLAHVEGSPVTRLNGAALGSQPVGLRSGDRLELAGVEMEFLLA